MILTKVVIKAILTALFIGCLFSVPYGYYQFLRLASFVLFGILTYGEYKVRNYVPAVFCVCAALLFNPLLPVYLGNDVWQAIDKIMAALLLLWIFIDLTLLAIRKRKEVGHEVSNTTFIKMRTVNDNFAPKTINTASAEHRKSEQEIKELNN